MSQALYEFERKDGIRMPFNLWPRSKFEALKCVLPFAAMYTPLKPVEDLAIAEYAPVLCKHCTAALSPFAHVDYVSKMWACPHCQNRNYLPSTYAGITQDHKPVELFQSSTTIEYILNASAGSAPVYIFIVDTAVTEDELIACKSTLVQALQIMPENALVGLITFGMHVHVHEIRQTFMPKVFVFRGSGNFKAATVASQLGLRRHATSQHDAFPAGKFLAPLSEAEFEISQALEGLQPDVHQPVSDHRRARCTGTAVQVAAGLAAMGLNAGVHPVRLMLFVGGPCTEGDAAIVSKELSVMIRSHKDLDADKAPLWRPAVDFYDALRKQLVASSHSLDVFACALEQSGVAEMKPAIQASGGMVVQTDTFKNPVFKDSLTRVFSNSGDAGFFGRCSCAVLSAICSPDVKIQGVLGCCASQAKTSPHVSNTKVGEGGTFEWSFPSLDQSSTACVVFEITADPKDPSSISPDEALFLQFSTKYLHYDGSQRQRVTTISRRWISGRQPADVLAGVDQEAAAVVLARLLTWKMEMEADFDATRWLDRTLIRLCHRFATYIKDDANSFRLNEELFYFPGFMFHLRRSQFVQVFGNSPDETAFARLMLFKEHTQNCVLMIQPQLYRYAMQDAPGPVQLDVSSITNDDILFLDTYFYLVLYHGLNVARWRQEGYQDNPEYADFAAFLQGPQEEAAGIIKTRFPVPRCVDADNHTVAGRSQSRFLLVKLNPSSTHQSNSGPGEVILTDDVSLEVFLQHLKKLAVQD